MMESAQAAHQVLDAVSVQDYTQVKGATMDYHNIIEETF